MARYWPVVHGALLLLPGLPVEGLAQRTRVHDRCSPFHGNKDCMHAREYASHVDPPGRAGRHAWTPWPVLDRRPPLISPGRRTWCNVTNVATGQAAPGKGVKLPERLHANACTVPVRMWRGKRHASGSCTLTRAFGLDRSGEQPLTAAGDLCRRVARPAGRVAGGPAAASQRHVAGRTSGARAHITSHVRTVRCTHASARRRSPILPETWYDMAYVRAGLVYVRAYVAVHQCTMISIGDCLN